MQDFSFKLTGGPTEQQLLDMRLSALREQDSERKLLLEEERKRLWAAIEIEAQEKAAEARRIAR